jgi:4-hydroxy-2-oxovalerate/4-hydroxy-2-oxohexanoate aldolase
VELGRKKMIGGQEDMIEDTAMTMARALQSGKIL